MDDCFVFMKGILFICILINYLICCKYTEEKWETHKKINNYQGLCIGDIIISILILPLVLIKLFKYVTMKIRKILLDLMNIKIKK